MKILINAYACSPYEGSEPGMGWNFVSHLSHHHELHIITECKYMPDFERYFKEHPEEEKYYHFYYVKRLRLNKLRKIWPPSYYWTYAAWQRKVLKLAQELEEKEHFDLIHQLNMVGYREPGYLFRMKKPIVWGPMGNFNITPLNMLPILGFKGAVFFAFRNLLNWKDMHFTKRVQEAVHSVDAIICATQEDQQAVNRLYGKDSVVIPEVGLSVVTDANHQMAVRQSGEKLRICWSGIHVARKALPILLHALAKCSHRDDMELHILGSGPFTAKWKKLAAKLNLQHVIWHGQTSREQALDVMMKCHVFAQTSLSDATSTVLLEALSLKMPVVALNHLGFAGVITESCGIKIDLTNPEQVTTDFASVFDKFYQNESYRQELANGAYLRAQDFSWEKKVEILNEIYNKVINV